VKLAVDLAQQVVCAGTPVEQACALSLELSLVVDEGTERAGA